jgi:hypothetical protein
MASSFDLVILFPHLGVVVEMMLSECVDGGVEV